MRRVKWMLVLVAMFACGYVVGGLGYGKGATAVAHAQEAEFTYRGVPIPKIVDVVAFLTPRIENDDVRLWFTTVPKSVLAEKGTKDLVWTNVIVGNENTVVFGINLDEEGPELGQRAGQSHLLGTRLAEDEQ